MTNQSQIDYWNGDAGATWVRQAKTFNLMFAHLGKEMLERAQLVSGEQVLDISCGSGATSFLAQDQVGAEGQVPGTDASQGAAFIAGMGGLARLVREKKINKGRLIDVLTDALEERMENGVDELKRTFGWLLK